MGRYAADGSINVTVIAENDIRNRGQTAPDGSLYVTIVNIEE